MGKTKDILKIEMQGISIKRRYKQEKVKDNKKTYLTQQELALGAEDQGL